MANNNSNKNAKKSPVAATPVSAQGPNFFPRNGSYLNLSLVEEVFVVDDSSLGDVEASLYATMGTGSAASRQPKRKKSGVQSVILHMLSGRQVNIEGDEADAVLAAIQGQPQQFAPVETPNDDEGGDGEQSGEQGKEPATT